MKKGMSVIGLLFLVITCLILPFQVNAAVITRTYDFNFSTITSDDLSIPPVDPVIGSVTISFDPSFDYGNISTVEIIPTGITLNYLNLDLDSQIGFAYSHEYDILIIGGIANGSAVQMNDNDFSLSMYDYMGSTGYMPSLLYTKSGFNTCFSSYDGKVDISTTPVPAAIWIFGSGIVGLAGLIRRRKNNI